QFSVSLPERRYDLVGHVLANAFERAQDGDTLDEAVHNAARDEGLRTAESAERGGSEPENMAETLALHGYEPRTDGNGLVLANCPFDSLARDHMELVCSANHAFIQG